MVLIKESGGSSVLFLLLSILSSALIAILLRLSSDKVRNPLSMLLSNYLACILLGTVYCDFRFFLPEESGFSTCLGLGLFNGFLYLASFITYQLNTQKNGIVLSSIFMKLGLLVPMVVSVLFFREIPTVFQITGFLLAIIAILLINRTENTEKKSLGFGLILLLLLGGSADAMSKVFEELGPGHLAEQFLLYTFLTAFILCLALAAAKKQRLTRWELLFGFAIGIPNFFSARFLLAALNSLDAVIVYPTYSVATILLITLAGTAFFRERLKKRQWAALSIILLALVLLNL